MIKLIRLISTACSILFLSSCGENSESRVERSIGEYLNSTGPSIRIPKSVFRDNPFPREIETGHFDVKTYDKMYDLGLLTRESVKVESNAISVFRKKEKVDGFKYDLSEKGKSMLQTKHNRITGESKYFKVGTYKLIEVTNKTEPSEMQGYKVMHVNYTFKSEGVADEFVKSGLLNKKEVGENLERKDTLIKTDKGWVHEKLWSE